MTYKKVKASMRARIVDQEWTPGALIPNEKEIAGEYGCCRATVSRVLRKLADTGFVERRRKAGTRVAYRESRAAVIRIPLCPSRNRE